MNTIIKKSLLSAGMAIMVVVGVLLPARASAANDEKPMKPMKGGEHQRMLQGVNTKEELDSLKTEDSIAMVCAKCKTVWVTRVRESVKGGQLLKEGGQTSSEVIGKHACKGCNSTLTVVGVPKESHLELKHSCGACGSDSAFCCATRSGSGPTKGMEKDKETK